MSSEIKVSNVKAKDGTAGISIADSTGNVSLSGTLSAGTIGSSVVVPATTSGCVKLYSNSVSGVASFEVDGYFDDTKYAYYELHLGNVKQTTTETDKHIVCQVISGGSAITAHEYWTTGTGSYNQNGTVHAMDRGDVDGNLSYFYLDQTWYLATSDNAPRSENIVMKFSHPSSTTRFFQAIIWSYGNGHNASNDYDVWQGTTAISWQNAAAVTGFKFLKHSGASTTLESSISLFGFRK